MRRVDRQMKPAFAWAVFDKASHGVVAVKDSYAIPVSVARVGEVIYFHGAKSGRFNELVLEDSFASVVVVGDVSPSHYDLSVEYESGIFKGTLEVVTDEAEAVQALLAITERYTPHMLEHFHQEILLSLPRTVVFRLDPQEITAKRKKFDEAGHELKGDFLANDKADA